MTHATQPDNPIFMPLLMSLLVHVLLVGFIVLYQPTTKAPKHIETILISQGELSQIQDAIRENARLAQMGNDGQDTANRPQNRPTKSDIMQAYDQSLAQKEAQYQQQMAEFTKSLEEQAQAAMQAHQEYLTQSQQATHEELERLRQLANNESERIAQNQQELDKARAMRDDRIAQEEQKQQRLSGKAGSLSAGDDTALNTSGTNANDTKKSAGDNMAGITAALVAHIEPHWQVPSGKTGKRVSAKIRVDDNGNVISVVIFGDDVALKNSLENAIRNASPLLPIVGTTYRTLTPTFVAD